jgi:tetratricopeptide (TPR) repeat protein
MNHKQRLAVLASASILVYLNSFCGDFQLDDYNVIVFNPAVHSWSAWLADTSRGIRPLLKFSYTLNWTSGLGLSGFHLLNLSIHIINTIIIYNLSLGLIRAQQDMPDILKTQIPFIAALFFAVHPIQTEAITYISGRSASLMTLFYLGSLLAYMQGRDKNHPLFVYVLSPVLFLFAVAVKEVAVTLPAALLLWEVAVQEKPFFLRRVLKYQWIHWTLFFCLAALILIHPGYYRLISFSFGFRSVYDNILSQINGVSYLLSRLFMVHELNIDPDLPVITKWSPLLTLKTSFLLFILYTGILCRKKYPWVLFGICWFFLHLIPANSIVPRIDIINERHFYLAGWGIFLVASSIIALPLAEHIRKQQYLCIFPIILCLTLGIFTISRNNIYRSEIALWEDTAIKSPNKARIYNNLGYAYYIAGRSGEAKNAYLRALELDPDFILAKNNLSLIENKRRHE